MAQANCPQATVGSNPLAPTCGARGTGRTWQVRLTRGLPGRERGVKRPADTGRGPPATVPKR